jgi:hypothetical protein
MPAKAKKPSDKEQVESYLSQLDYPLKDVVEALRQVILTSSEKLNERIKWNAPSYFTNVDLLTINLRSTEFVMIVFHHVSIVEIRSPELKGDYKDRRLMYFHGMNEVVEKTITLRNIIKEYLSLSAVAGD